MPAIEERSFRGSEVTPGFREPISKDESYPAINEPRRPARPFVDDDDKEDNRSFVRRNRVAICVIVVAAIAVAFLVRTIARSGNSPRKESSVVLITLPPPPPPPPPVQTAPPEPRMDEQTFQPEEKPQEEPPKPPDEPPIGTNIKGDGTANSFGLGSGGGNGFGSRGGTASRFGWYAGQVQTKVSEALRNNRKTHAAELSIRARIWPDATGRITRAQLSGSTGDPSLDSAIENEVLNGLQLREPPPAGMPLPIVLRLTARRPH